MPVQNIVFDIGGVLANFRMSEFLSEKGFDAPMQKRILKATLMTPYWGKFERGEISEEETMEGFARTDPEILEEISRAFSDLKGLLLPTDFCIPLVKGLRDKGYHVYYLSNYSKKAFDECASSLCFMPYMEGGLISFRAGLTKPDPRMFLRFLEEFSLPAQDCLFIDDTAENVSVASSLGFQAVQFSSYEELLKDFQRLGILF